MYTISLFVCVFVLLKSEDTLCICQSKLWLSAQFTCHSCFGFKSGAQVDYWLEPEHREEAHTFEAGVWSFGGLQEKVAAFAFIFMHAHALGIGVEKKQHL